MNVKTAVECCWERFKVILTVSLGCIVVLLLYSFVLLVFVAGILTGDSFAIPIALFCLCVWIAFGIFLVKEGYAEFKLKKMEKSQQNESGRENEWYV